MAETIRTYPDITFVDTDTERLTNSLIQSYQMFTGRTLYPADPVRLFLLWVADIIAQERVNLDFAAKQNLPRYAEGEYLDSLAELFKDTQRLDAEKAKTTLQFTLSIQLDNTVIIPAGTRAAIDGDIVFATLQECNIPAGERSVETIAECLTAGEIGNGFLPGQINQLIDIFPFFESVQNVTESTGGAEIDSDAAFYERMRESVETFSTAGPLGAYEYYAKSASALIADVKATSPTPGQVDVRVLLQGGELPGEEMIRAVSDILTSDKVRPLTDYVTVSAPETMDYTIDITYYTQEHSALSTQVIAENVSESVRKFQKWQSEKMGRDINPSYLISLLMQTGIKRVEIRSPVFAVTPENTVAKVSDITIVNGGSELE